MLILLVLPEQPIINDMHKTNSQFRDKYDIKSFVHTEVLTSLLHVYQSKHNCDLLFVELYVHSYSYE